MHTPRHIALDTGHNLAVSTIRLLGPDHAGRSFETLVLDRDGEVIDADRYFDRAQAQRGHFRLALKWVA
jgi:hypothetical protein